jgi:sialate O-acetylesterase
VLELGPIDDMDTTWLNGRRIGGLEGYGQWRTPRRYAIPAGLLHAGKNVVAVRVLDTGGAGGICGESQDMVLRSKGGTAISLAGSWRYQTGAELGAVGRPPARNWMNQNRPAALFNAMLAPLVPLSVRGVIWYQGESNRLRAEQYKRLFPAMIADWRRLFQQPDLPFYFVQIAPFLYDGDAGEAALLRDAQRRALAVPHTGMAVTMDIGIPENIHPSNKQDVGRRLALWALAKDYGRDDLDFSGPLVSRIEFEGSGVRVFFEHAVGLTSDGKELSHFTLAGDDGVYHAASAEIDGESVVVRSAEVARPRSIRFGGGAADQTNLWNASGLPASSFVCDVP